MESYAGRADVEVGGEEGGEEGRGDNGAWRWIWGLGEV